MKLYLAGPMRGHPLFNFPAFFHAAMILRKLGHEILSPAEKDMAAGLNPALPLDHPDNAAVFSLSEAFEWDFSAILASDGIVMLPGWRASKGVQAELVLAMAMEREVFEYCDGGMASLTLAGYTVSFI